MSSHIKSALAFAGATLLAVHGVFAQSVTRDFTEIEDLMSQVANYNSPLPNATASEWGHQQRMRGFFEAKTFTELKRQTFVPVPDVRNTIVSLEELSKQAVQFISKSAQNQVESILLDVVRKDALAEASPKSFRQAQFLLEELSDDADREWSQSLKRLALERAARGVGELLIAREKSGLCSKSLDMLSRERDHFSALSLDQSIGQIARSVYADLARIVDNELLNRQHPSPTPVVCLPTVSVREFGSLRSVDPTLGLFSQGLQTRELEFDLFSIQNADEVIPLLDQNAKQFLRLRPVSRNTVRLEVLREPSVETVILVRFTVVDFMRNALAEVVLPVTLAAFTNVAVEPASPIANGTRLIGVKSGSSSSIEIKNNSKIELLKGQYIKLDGDILDQYGLSMGLSPVELKIVTDPSRVELMVNQNGGAQLLGKNVTDDSAPTIIQFQVNSFGVIPFDAKIGKPPVMNTLGGQFQVQTAFAKFNGFSSQEAQQMTARLYRAILQRDPDFPGANGWVKNIQKNSLKGLRETAVGLAKSSEFISNVQLKQSAEQILEKLYQELLGRSPDPSGRASYLPLIQARKTHDVAASLVGSTEFRNFAIGR